MVREGDTAPSVLFDADQQAEGELTAAEQARRERMREQASGVVSYATDAACERTVFALGGGLHQVTTANGSLTSLIAAEDAFDPRPAPTDERVAYLSGATLRITDGSSDGAVLGMGGDDSSVDSATVSWGSAEFVAAEEMGRGRGFWWAPDSSLLAVCRVDTSPVQSWWISSPERPDAPPREIRYPAAGTNNANVQLWLVDPDAGPKVEVDWAQGEFEYLADVQWGEKLLCTVQTRDQRVLAILEVDIADGSVREVQRHTDEHWVELAHNSPLSSDNGLITVVDDLSTRRVAVDGSMRSDVEVNMRQLVGVDGADIFVTATTDGTDAVFARMSNDGSLEYLTAPGDFTAASTRGGTHVLHVARSDAGTAHQVRWQDGTILDIESFAAEPGFPCTPDFHVVGSRLLNVALCLPDGHDGSPLPVLLDPYGGPHVQRVLRVRNGYASSQWFAEQGFAVVIIDGRGTPGRGPRFEREVWGDLAQPVLDDQIDALHALAEIRPELDTSRVGIRGWSFGGYLAALAVLRRPDAVHAAVAGAPVTDWRLYDTHYTERYLGHPDEYPEHYQQSGLIADAASLTRPLMLIHGLADDNVVAAHTLTLSQALLEAGRAHEVLPLPGVTHMTPQEQVAENLLHLQRDFLLKHLSQSVG